MSRLTRRNLLKRTAIAGAAAQLPRLGTGFPAPPATAHGAVAPTVEPVEVHWLEGGAPAERLGVTWGGCRGPRASSRPTNPSR